MCVFVSLVGYKQWDYLFSICGCMLYIYRYMYIYLDIFMCVFIYIYIHNMYVIVDSVCVGVYVPV